MTQEGMPSVPHRRNRIDFEIVVNLSRLAPPNINLINFRQDNGTHSLTDYPLMRLQQTRDLHMEVDEIKKAIQDEVWTLFALWHQRSSYNIYIDVMSPESRRLVSQKVDYDSTLEEVINMLQLPPRRGQLKLHAIPCDYWAAPGFHLED